MISNSIFKAYDIRGIIDKTLDDQVAFQIGQAFGAAALAKGQKKVVIGRDGRLSGPSLSAALHPRAGHAVRHHGHRQPQSAGLQRFQDGAGR